MKKVLAVIVAATTLSLAAKAQTKPVVTAIIKTPNALCQACKERIEGQLKRYDGISEATVNFKKGETKVKYITDRINIEEIKAIIANCGYDADDVPAAEDMYNRLPKTCKKFEDGGGHPKPKVVPPPQQK
ncbi:MAG: heavy-metal-associated domain-containing protein [Chitinophagaceae bacterium]|nr:heavy-metal-associated domain-containing protein [Chitinophagaceae bacterium]